MVEDEEEERDVSPELPKPQDTLSDFAKQLFGLPSGNAPQFGFSSGLFSLANLAPPPPPPVIKDRWFKDQTVHIDGYTFERCRFDGCVLVTETGVFTFRECYVGPSCQLYLGPVLLKTVQLLLHTLRIQGRVEMLGGEEGVFAKENPDGTFSIE